MDLALSPQDLAFQEEVRAFLRDNLTAEMREAGAKTGGVFAEFEVGRRWHRTLAKKGWSAPTWPKEHGGTGWTATQRYIFSRECTAADAPRMFNMSVRMVGPVVMKFGTPAQKAKYLPGIVSGDIVFCQGYSEPGSGSDLASLKTRAESDGDDYVINGTKIWTTNAHRAHYMVALVRTSGETADRHAGLSQILIDLSAPGVTVRPIKDMAGRAHFNEVSFEDVALPAAALIGSEGDGWKQVMAELAYERSGPERYLSSLQCLILMIDAAANAPADERLAVAIGRAVAHLAVLRQMSLSVAGQLQAGLAPNLEAALVKDLGTTFEQSLIEIVHDALAIAPSPDGTQAERVLARLMQLAPCFSLRGGTREILRGIIARGLGLR